MVNSKSSVFLFIGSEGYLKDKAIKDLSSSVLGGSSRDLNYKVFYGAESDSREILDYAATMPFLAEKRVIIVKDFDELSEECKSRLISYIEKPLKSTCLILETKGDSVLKKYSRISRHVNIQYFKDPENSKLLAWIKKSVTAKGKSIEDQAAEALKELQGKNLLSLTQEIDKLAAFVGERSLITVKDIEELVGKSLVASAFDLIDAVEKKDINLAMKIVSDLMMTGKRPYETIGLLCWHLKRLLRAKILQARGEPDSVIANLLRINRRYYNEFFRQAKGISIPQIKSKMAILLEADLDIKRTKYDPALILEFAVIRLCLS